MTIRILAAAMLVTLFSFNAYAGSSCCDKKKADQQSECKKPCDKDGKTTDSECKKPCDKDGKTTDSESKK